MQYWAVDFEFVSLPGENPRPLCVVAHNLVGGQRIRKWIDPENPGECPYPTGPDDVMLAYYASAEIGCHIALGWPVPQRVIDLCAEFKLLTSGLFLKHGRGQLGALLHFGLATGVTAEKKQDWQRLAAGGGNLSQAEKEGLLDYCEADVTGLSRLWNSMRPGVDEPRALIRGRYMCALAAVESHGVPIDTTALGLLRENMDTLKPRLIAEVDKDFGVYDGTKFSMAAFGAYLATHDIPWPRTEVGRLCLDDQTFRSMAALHPRLQPLRELRTTISRLKLFDLAVSSDGRNRTLLSAFGSKTGRNQPSNTRFIFGPSAWVRFLIKPKPGMALAYIDWSQQEFAVAAAMSGDVGMMDAYRSGDPYLAFARMAGAVPEDATKESHPEERGRFKVCALAVQYGMGAARLGESLGLPKCYGRDLLMAHRITFPRSWEWLDRVGVTARGRGHILSTFGWRLNVDGDTRPTTIANWPCQANGAEMLRLALIGAVERGVRVVAPVHDALLIEAPAEAIEEAVEVTRGQMAEASRVILDGFAVDTDVEVVRPGDRYTDERGREMWDLLGRLLPALGQNQNQTYPKLEYPPTPNRGTYLPQIGVPGSLITY